MPVSWAIWMSKNRKPRQPPEAGKKAAALPPGETKRTAATVPQPPEEQQCSWRFGTLDRNYPKSGGWESIPDKDRLNIIVTLAHCDSTPWLTVQSAPAKQIGGMVIYDASRVQDNFAKRAKKRLRQLSKGIGWDRITRIRLGNRKRLWAIHHQDNTLDILWWDPDHKVHPTDP